MPENGGYDEEFWGSRRPRRRRRWHWPIVILLLLGLVGGVSYWAYQLSSSWLQSDDPVAGDAQPGDSKPGAKSKTRGTVLLLLGIDRRTNEPARADTIILTFISPDGQKASLLSIPRDTYTAVPGRGMTKISHAHAYGGIQLMTQSVANLLDLPVDKYVELDFQGFKEIIDILGGIELEVEKRMYYPQEDIDLQAGKQLLNGYDALGYVRFRSDAMGDIGRIQRQQKFLRVMTDQLLQPRTILDLPRLLPAVMRNMKTNLALKDTLALGGLARDLDKVQLDARMLPGEAVYIEGISYWRPHEAEIDRLTAEFRAVADGKE